VVPEAAAIGIPAIVSDGCAAVDAIIDGVTGLKFRSGDAADLAAKMSTLTSDLATTMGRAAYERFWSDPPLMSKHLAALNEVYSTILSRRSTTTGTVPDAASQRRAKNPTVPEG
jgi:glycosyltransferase involved in cell wall biosynthesis